MQFELLTPDGAKFQGQAEAVHLKTSGGDISVLPRHEPLTAIAMPGPLHVQLSGGKRQTFAMQGGVLSVRQGVVQLMADEAETAEELIEEEIKAALAKAQQLKSAAKSKGELERAQQLIDRHQVRLHVARLRRRRHP